jgi:CubicO group peptidase (beta-lactamase class C family)
VQHGVVLWSEGFGVADRRNGAHATPETLFRVGSVSKLLTAAALMRLVDARAVDLDASIRAYVGFIPTHWPDVTLRQLAGHTAGVRHYRGSEFFSRTEYPTLQEAADIFIADSLLFPPGSRYAYSSYGYNLLGAVLESVTGEPFPWLLQRLVLAPLGMTHTVPDSFGVMIPGRAALYSIGRDSVTDASTDNLSSRWPSGGYLSSTEDLARFGAGVMESGFLTAGSLDVMFGSQWLTSGDSTSVGIGWRLGVDAEGRRYMHHGGSSNGGSAFLLIVPEAGLVVAMAANALGSWSTAEALCLADLFRR